LFSPQRARTPVKALSGGERARLLLAKLFTRPANLLVLDEPTNDLDVETLELLEEVLMEFKGTVLIVSHDRAFLDNVVTSTLVFDGSGKVREYVGGFDDWLRQGGSIRLLGAADEMEAPAQAIVAAQNSPAEQPSPAKSAADSVEPKKKLSYKLQRELDALPGQIEDLEIKLAELHEQVAQVEFYQQPIETTEAVLAHISTVQEQLDVLIERWTELDS
jgi:ATP-binding cassette subfamily F protein uup